jgi:hypothetical protein
MKMQENNHEIENLVLDNDFEKERVRQLALEKLKKRRKVYGVVLPISLLINVFISSMDDVLFLVLMPLVTLILGVTAGSILSLIPIEKTIYKDRFLNLTLLSCVLIQVMFFMLFFY